MSSNNDKHCVEMDSLNRNAHLGAVLALVSAVGYSAKSIFVKMAYLDGVDAVTLLALRMVFSVPFFVGVALWHSGRRAEALGVRDWILVVALGLIGYFLASLLDFLGLEYISAGVERLIVFLYPTMTVILSAVAYKRRIERKTFLALILSYSGIVLVFLHGAEIKQEGFLLGVSLVLASTFAYSVYLVGAGHVIARIGTERFTAYALMVASAASLLQFFFMRPMGALDLPLRVYQLAIGMAVVSTVLPSFLLAYAIRRIGAARASLISSIGPVSTIGMAYVFLKEDVSLLQIAGSLLVLGGVLVVSLGEEWNPKKRDAREPVKG